MVLKEKMILRERLISLRDQAGISQAELAERLDVSRQTVTSWESGKTAPTRDNLKSLAALYGVTMDWLCGEDSAPYEKSVGAEQKPEKLTEEAQAAPEPVKDEPETLQKKRKRVLFDFLGALIVLIGLTVGAILQVRTAKQSDTAIPAEDIPDIEINPSAWNSFSFD